KAGIEIKGTIKQEEDKNEIHKCNRCIDGEFNFKLECKFEASLFWDNLKAEVKIAEISIKISDWYYSFDLNEFGFGNCPHKLYKVIFHVRNSKNKPVANATIGGIGFKVLNEAGEPVSVTSLVTDQNGCASVFQARIILTVALITAPGYANKGITYSVSDKKTDVNITLPTQKQKQEGGEHHSGVKSLKNPRRHDDGSVTYSTVYFGKYWQNDTNGDGIADKDDNKQPIKWRVLWIEGDDMLLLADENLDTKEYHPYSAGFTWENCYLRKWLNGMFTGEWYDIEGGFLIDAFDETEREEIKNTELTTESWEFYDGSTGWVINPVNTVDKVFILSEDDIYNENYGFLPQPELSDEYSYLDPYDEMDKARVGYNTAFTISNGAWTHDSGIYAGGGMWWLRSVNSNWTLKAVQAAGIVVNSDSIINEAVRPALHLSKSSDIYTLGEEITITPFEHKVESAGWMEASETQISEAAQATGEEEQIATGNLSVDCSSAVFAKSVASDEDGSTSAYFDMLECKNTYNLYVMKNEFADDSLSDNNLMYMSQGISDEEGKLTFSYRPKEVSDNMAVFVVGMKAKENSGSTDPTDPTDPSNPDNPENDTIALTGIDIDKKTADTLEGETFTLNLSFTPEDAANKKVTWSSSDASVATVADGVVTAVKEGKATIKAVSEDGNHEAICEVTVKAKEGPLGPDKPDLSKYTASGNEIAVKSINLKKIVFKGVKGIEKFEATSGDAASVKIKGSTLTVLKDGTVTVTAFNKKKEKLAEKTLTLIAPAIDTTLRTEINRRGNLDLNKYISSTLKPAKWKSSSKKIAEVSQDGLLTMKKSGKVKITVTFPAEKGMKAKTLTIKLNIKMPQFKKTSYAVKVSKTVSTAVKNASAADITYKIENPNIATVDAYGKVTGVSKGTTKLIMTVKGIDYETKIKVK
ncbi:MAG: Ig-like domain-containing protein, partial [Eubacterium sp.]|nr:Ig-like domain-containing protein [Eubacterium sp.]